MIDNSKTRFDLSKVNDSSPLMIQVALQEYCTETIENGRSPTSG